MALWPEWAEAGLDRREEDDEEVPGFAGFSAPGVEFMYLWSPCPPAYISLMAEIRHQGNDEPR